MKRTRLIYAALLSLLLAFGLCHHALAAGEGTKLADFYLTKLPAPALAPSPTLDQAMKIQAEFNKAITPVFGKVVGYKAGLTNPSVQKVFGVTAPVRGTLMEKMILKSGTTIEANFGARPLYEGDLILRVGSDAINGANNTDGSPPVHRRGHPLHRTSRSGLCQRREDQRPIACRRQRGRPLRHRGGADPRTGHPGMDGTAEDLQMPDLRRKGDYADRGTGQRASWIIRST